jgi:NhaA family Na+:H+ antiporter
LAIIDDLGAIVIIALFYTSGLSYLALSVVAMMIVILFWLNYSSKVNNTAYILIGTVMWVATLKSGVHATLAGVILGLFIPVKNNKVSFRSLEESLHVPVNHVILPLFAFVNTGINFDNISSKDFVDTVTLGIALGLFVGKQLGIFIFSWMAIKFKIGLMPEGIEWRHIYAVAILGGVGFTMSLFMGSLAFECSQDICMNVTDERLGILIGSVFSGVVGYIIMRVATKDARA